jgi:chemotaxis protein MotA
MDLATILGLLGGLGVVLGAMAFGGEIGIFVNTPSLLIVVVGTLLTAMTKFTLGQYLQAGKVAAKAFMFKSVHPNVIIDEVVEMADIARKNGVLALEGKEVSVPFMKRGLTMLIDGMDSEKVRDMLDSEAMLIEERHESGIGIFKAMGDVAPAMGMIGTLVGLVQMLSNMSDPKSIGPAMAVALLTTLYGAMIATVICLPLADKLTLRNREESLNSRLIIEGLMAISEGQNPRIIKQKLKTFLPEKKRGEED